METIKLNSELLEKITYWNVKSLDNSFNKDYKKSLFSTPEKALKEARKKCQTSIVITGLTMHAETKPVLSDTV